MLQWMLFAWLAPAIIHSTDREIRREFLFFFVVDRSCRQRASIPVAEWAGNLATTGFGCSSVKQSAGDVF
jgi:hypothetical protein